MNRLLARAGLRYLTRHPWQVGLAVVGIALGVAVVVAIHLAQHSARVAFDLATRTVVGHATHRIIGQSNGIPEALYGPIRAEFHDLSPTPVIDATVAVADHGNYGLRLIGIDPVMERSIRGTWRRDGQTFDPARLMTVPGGAIINETTAARLGLAKGEKLNVRTGVGTAALEVIGIVPPARTTSRYGLAGDVAVVDIATAQEVLGISGRLSHIELHVDPTADVTAIMERLRAAVPGDVEVIDTGVQTSRIRQMTNAFYTNLTALSLLALLVGMFLIYNTETFLVIQRRTVIGRLRALGATQTQILALIMIEALLIGAVGSITGVITGTVLARGLVTLVAQTLNDLYFSVSVSKVYLSPLIAASGVALGVVATAAAALPPAIEATRAAPDSAMRRSDLETRARHKLHLWARLGTALVIVSIVIMGIPSKSVFIGFVCLWSLVVGCAMLTPAATAALVSALQRVPFVFREPPQKLALRSVSATMSRTSVATMALMIATATGIGIGVMIASFRGSVVDWLDTLLRADIYVADANAADPFAAAAIDPELLDRLRKLPGVETLSTVRRLDVGSGTERVELAAYGLPPQARAGFQFKRGNAGDIWDRWVRDDVVIVSEPFAYRRDVALGDRLELHGKDGPKDFEIVGIYYDYSSEHGLVAISRSTFERHWNDRCYNGIGVYAAPLIDDDQLMAAIRAVLPANATFTVRSIAALKADSLAVFDRTFAITGVLRLLAVIVAFIGVLGALLALQLERTREFGVLRALGFSDAEIRRLVLTHTGLIGFAAGLIAIPVGIVMAAVLIFVINLRSFGWTMAVDVPPFVLAQAWTLAVIAALLAGVIPAVKATRVPPAVALRYE